MTSFLGMNHAKRHSVNCVISDITNVHRCGCHEKKTKHTDNPDYHFSHRFGVFEFCSVPRQSIQEVVEWVSQVGVSSQEHREDILPHLVFESDTQTPPKPAGECTWIIKCLV